MDKVFIGFHKIDGTSVFVPSILADRLSAEQKDMLINKIPKYLHEKIFQKMIDLNNE